jgi:hypothetical protein
LLFDTLDLALTGFDRVMRLRKPLVADVAKHRLGHCKEGLETSPVT